MDEAGSASPPAGNGAISGSASQGVSRPVSRGGRSPRQIENQGSQLSETDTSVGLIGKSAANEGNSLVESKELRASLRRHVPEGPTKSRSKSRPAEVDIPNQDLFDPQESHETAMDQLNTQLKKDLNIGAHPLDQISSPQKKRLLNQLYTSEWNVQRKRLKMAWRRFKLDIIADVNLLWLGQVYLEEADQYDDWARHFSSKGSPYYYNAETNETTWIGPLDHMYKYTIERLRIREQETEKDFLFRVQWLKSHMVEKDILAYCQYLDMEERFIPEKEALWILHDYLNCPMPPGYKRVKNDPTGFLNLKTKEIERTNPNEDNYRFLVRLCKRRAQLWATQRLQKQMRGFLIRRKYMYLRCTDQSMWNPDITWDQLVEKGKKRYLAAKCIQARWRGYTVMSSFWTMEQCQKRLHRVWRLWESVRVDTRNPRRFSQLVQVFRQIINLAGREPLLDRQHPMQMPYSGLNITYDSQYTRTISSQIQYVNFNHLWKPVRMEEVEAYTYVNAVTRENLPQEENDLITNPGSYFFDNTLAVVPESAAIMIQCFIRKRQACMKVEGLQRRKKRHSAHFKDDLPSYITVNGKDMDTQSCIYAHYFVRYFGYIMGVKYKDYEKPNKIQAPRPRPLSINKILSAAYLARIEPYREYYLLPLARMCALADVPWADDDMSEEPEEDESLQQIVEEEMAISNPIPVPAEVRKFSMDPELSAYRRGSSVTGVVKSLMQQKRRVSSLAGGHLRVPTTKDKIAKSMREEFMSTIRKKSMFVSPTPEMIKEEKRMDTANRNKLKKQLTEKRLQDLAVQEEEPRDAKSLIREKAYNYSALEGLEDLPDDDTVRKAKEERSVKKRVSSSMNPNLYEGDNENKMKTNLQIPFFREMAVSMRRKRMRMAKKQNLVSSHPALPFISGIPWLMLETEKRDPDGEGFTIEDYYYNFATHQRVSASHAASLAGPRAISPFYLPVERMARRRITLFKEVSLSLQAYSIKVRHLSTKLSKKIDHLTNGYKLSRDDIMEWRGIIWNERPKQNQTRLHIREMRQMEAERRHSMMLDAQEKITRAVITLQCFVRVTLSRKRVESRHQEKLSPYSRVLTANATKIQAVFRGSRVRRDRKAVLQELKDKKAERAASIRIQTMWRARQARMRVARKKKNKERRLQQMRKEAERSSQLFGRQRRRVRRTESTAGVTPEMIEEYFPSDPRKIKFKATPDYLMPFLGQRGLKPIKRKSVKMTPPGFSLKYGSQPPPTDEEYEQAVGLHKSQMEAFDKHRQQQRKKSQEESRAVRKSQMSKHLSMGSLVISALENRGAAMEEVDYENLNLQPGSPPPNFMFSHTDKPSPNKDRDIRIRLHQMVDGLRKATDLRRRANRANQTLPSLSPTSPPSKSPHRKRKGRRTPGPPSHPLAFHEKVHGVRDEQLLSSCVRFAIELERPESGPF